MGTPASNGFMLKGVLHLINWPAVIHKINNIIINFIYTIKIILIELGQLILKYHSIIKNQQIMLHSVLYS